MTTFLNSTFTNRCSDRPSRMNRAPSAPVFFFFFQAIDMGRHLKSFSFFRFFRKTAIDGHQAIFCLAMLRFQQQPRSVCSKGVAPTIAIARREYTYCSDDTLRALMGSFYVARKAWQHEPFRTVIQCIPGGWYEVRHPVNSYGYRISQVHMILRRIYCMGKTAVWSQTTLLQARNMTVLLLVLYRMLTQASRYLGPPSAELRGRRRRYIIMCSWVLLPIFVYIQQIFAFDIQPCIDTFARHLRSSTSLDDLAQRPQIWWRIHKKNLPTAFSYNFPRRSITGFEVENVKCLNKFVESGLSGNHGSVCCSVCDGSRVLLSFRGPDSLSRGTYITKYYGVYPILMSCRKSNVQWQ